MSKLEIDLKAYEGQEIRIKIKDGVAVIEAAEKEPEVGKLPEVGYWVNNFSNVEEETIKGKESWESEYDRNIYPRENHAILVGQILAPLLVKHWELTGGYWEKRADTVVKFSCLTNSFEVLNGFGSDIGPLDFPFPNYDLAQKFLDKNKSQLNELARLWQEG